MREVISDPFVSEVTEGLGYGILSDAEHIGYNALRGHEGPIKKFWLDSLENVVYYRNTLLDYSYRGWDRMQNFMSRIKKPAHVSIAGALLTLSLCYPMATSCSPRIADYAYIRKDDLSPVIDKRSIPS